MACGAESADSVSVANYYQNTLRDKPQGVYEWPEEGLLFVQARLPYTAKRTSDRMDGDLLLAQQRELFAWLVKGVAPRVDASQDLSAGLSKVREVVRRYYPTWGYTVDWHYSFEGQRFNYEASGERVSCVVCAKAEVEKTRPANLAKPISSEEWLKGLKSLISDRYYDRVNAAFMADLGFYDGIVSCGEVADNIFIKSAEGAASHEFAKVSEALTDYLSSSERSSDFHEAMRAIEQIPSRRSFSSLPPKISASTNVVVTVTTNLIESGSVETNTRKCSAKGVTPFMVCGDVAYERAVCMDDAIVTTEETVTIVTTRRALRQRIDKTYSADPKFEKLFLSGGTNLNDVVARTELGKKAEKVFFAKGTAESREKILLEALRENPGDKVLWNLYGRMLQNQSDYYGALICFRNAIRLDHTYDFALTNLALTYRELKCFNLSFSAAIVAYGVADDQWCVKKSLEILSE